MRKKLLKIAALVVAGALMFTGCLGAGENESAAASETTVSDMVLNEISTIESVLYDSATAGKQQRMQVYLPAGYDSTQDSYPVLYLINGGGTDDTAWTGGGNMQEIMDELIVSGMAKPMIVVMPDGGLNDPSEETPGADRGQGQNQQWDGKQPQGDGGQWDGQQPKTATSEARVDKMETKAAGGTRAAGTVVARMAAVRKSMRNRLRLPMKNGSYLSQSLSRTSFPISTAAIEPSAKQNPVL